MTGKDIYDRLLVAYGMPQWWSDNPYQVIVEAILVQHTTWTSVEKLRPILKDKLTPSYIQALSQEELEALIRPCGFQKRKAQTIHGVTDWFVKKGCLDNAKTLTQLRKELLSLHGIGPETADVILVYAFHLPSFIVDAYTRTFLKRLGFLFLNDWEIKDFFEGHLGKNARLYGSIHWLILEHCIEKCQKNPLCRNCGFVDLCSTGSGKSAKA